MTRRLKRRSGSRPTPSPLPAAFVETGPNALDANPLFTLALSDLTANQDCEASARTISRINSLIHDLSGVFSTLQQSQAQVRLATRHP
jgi:hypothetical protein